MGLKGKSVAMIVKIMNCTTAVGIIALCTLSLITGFVAKLTNFEVFLLLSPIYMILFGICLLCAEFKVKIFMKRLSFMNSMLGRGVFNIYLSSVIYYYFKLENESVLAWVGASVVFGIGVVYLIMQCTLAKQIRENQEIDKLNDPAADREQNNEAETKFIV